MVRARVAEAATNLDELSRKLGEDLAAFAVFSSLADTLSASGTHAHLDALARRRREAGLPALSVAWGRCASIASGEPAESTPADGVRPMLPDPVLSVLEHAGAGGCPDYLAFADVDWKAFTAHWPERALRPLRDLPEFAASGLAPATGPGTRASIRPQLAAADAAERLRLLTDLVCREVAGALGHDAPDAVDADSGLLDLGLSSFTALEVANRLREALDEPLPAVAVFDNATPRALAEFIDRHLGGDSPTRQEQP